MKCFILLSILFIGAMNGQECDEYESYNECGTACEPSCETPNPTICTEHCVIGCQCNEGYLRRSDQKCVPSIQCNLPTIPPPPPTCLPYEYYVDCYNSCEEKKCPVSKNPPRVICPLFCTRGCSCIEGYYRNLQGRCVGESECPPIAPPVVCNKRCPPNQECALVQRICIRQPCTPIAECRPRTIE